MGQKQFRKFCGRLIAIIKKIPYLRDIGSFFVTRFAFRRRKLECFLEGYEAYLYDSTYVDEKNFEEPYIIKFLLNNVKEGDTFFDLGAHFGYFTLLAHKLVGSSGKIISFEPSPVPLNYLRKNIKLNKIENVTIVPMLVFDKKGELNFYFSGFGGTKSSLKKCSELPFVKKIRGINLDDYCMEENMEPNFVKIDIEGAELLAIKGFQKILRQKEIKILLELHPKILGSSDIKKLVNLFGDLGYSMKSLFPSGGSYRMEDFKMSRLPKHLFAIKKE